MKIKINCNEKIGGGVVDYNSEEGSLSFRPHLNSDIALLVSYINIGFDSDSMIANQVWGFTPKASWKEEVLTLPANICKGQLTLGNEYEPGTWRIDKEEMWTTYYDSKQNWLCIGHPNSNKNDKCVEFLENVVAIIDEQQQLRALWIKPNFAQA